MLFYLYPKNFHFCFDHFITAAFLKVSPFFFFSFLHHVCRVNSVFLLFSHTFHGISWGLWLLPSKQRASIATLRQQTLSVIIFTSLQCLPVLPYFWTDAHKSFVTIKFHIFFDFVFLRWENNQHISDSCYIWSPSPPHSKKSIDWTFQMFVDVEHQL